MRFLLGVVMLGVVAVPTWAQPTLDGSRADAGYSLRTVQTVETQFGDANPNNGSELDAAYAQIDDGTLYLVLTGNLESNFNKLNIFIDSIAGGQNTIGPGAAQGGSNPNNDAWAQNYSGVGPAASGNGPGFTFDAGFAADYMLILRNGSGVFDIDYAVIGGGGGAFEAAGNVFGGFTQGSNANALPGAGIGVAFNNSNVLGVLGGTGAANQAAAAAVLTGIELAIPLSALGNPDPQDIKISAHINGSNQDYLSNQSLGGFIPPQGNLGGDGTGGFNNDVSLLNLNNFAGEQCFTVVPEPTSAMLAGLALLALFGMVRRNR